MSKQLFIAIFLVFAVTLGVSAQAFTVNYLDGTVELQSAKGWTAINIGDQVPADASIRISQAGSIELRRGAAKLTLLKDGVYALATLAKASAAAGSTSVAGAITQKLQSLVTEKPKASTAGGVRGAEQGAGSVTWVDESDDARAQIQGLLDKKKYTDAVKELDDAIASASSDADVAEFNYMLGFAYYGSGQTARAYRVLSKLDPSMDVQWYARYVILKAQVLVDTQNYKDALAILTPFIDSHPTGEATQVAYLLSGVSQKGLGDATSARTALDAGYKLDPSTGTATLIDQQRKAL
jgi:tetratricopeptide (TPR) repeat protein